MAFKDKQTINVLNFNNYPVSVATRDESFVIEASQDGTPTKMPFTPTEIETINSKGNAFKSGHLRFEAHEESEIYEGLRIFDWQTIPTNEQIRDIILNPTYDGLKRIIDIRNSSMFERIRGMYASMKYSDELDISNRVARIIETRYQEILSGQSKSEIVLSQKDVEKKEAFNVDDVRAENAELKSEMEKMKAMLSELMTDKKASATSEDSQVEVKDKKPVGRPKATK